MNSYLNWSDITEDADINDINIKYYFDPCIESQKKDNLSHIFIEGDNYPSLKLLKKDFLNKISFIYIDPPYNTGKTSFTYNDSIFKDNKTLYSTKDKHSAWLSFMKRRLLCAKDLLSEDGCIFIAIGQESLYVLKLLCDQIFGEENFINNFMWLHGKGKKDKFSRTMQQSNLCYAKNKKKLNVFKDFEETSWARTNLDNDTRGNWFSGSISFDEKRSNENHPNFFEIISPSGIKWKRQWLISKEEMDILIANNKIYWGSAPDYKNVPRKKVFNGEKLEIIPKNIIDGTDSTRDAQNHLDILLDEKNSFDNPKPVDLVKHFLEITNMRKNIIVLDFFAGSGTTFESVVEMNKSDNGSRKCILIQKPEKIIKKSKFSNIAELCFERMKKVLPKSNNIEYYKLKEKPTSTVVH